ncbi:hypothetical protein BKA81DRAFT_347000 [Phyllosticta paracitricarpa]
MTPLVQRARALSHRRHLHHLQTNPPRPPCTAREKLVKRLQRENFLENDEKVNVRLLANFSFWINKTSHHFLTTTITGWIMTRSWAESFFSRAPPRPPASETPACFCSHDLVKEEKMWRAKPPGPLVQERLLRRAIPTGIDIPTTDGSAARRRPDPGPPASGRDADLHCAR